MTAFCFWVADERAAPARIQINQPLGERPANGGAEIDAASGGVGASIAQMYICTACRGEPLPPMPPTGGSVAAAAAERSENTIEQQKNHHLHIELTPAQYRLLHENAKLCRLSKRAYVVSLLEGTPVKARPSAEIKALRTEVHQIGNNINQIARSVNAGIATAEDAKRGLYLLDQVYEMMYRIAKQ